MTMTPKANTIELSNFSLTCLMPKIANNKTSDDERKNNFCVAHNDNCARGAERDCRKCQRHLNNFAKMYE